MQRQHVNLHIEPRIARILTTLTMPIPILAEAYEAENGVESILWAWRED
jgi:hypothetical protein